jgi:hypothetical protein
MLPSYFVFVGTLLNVVASLGYLVKTLQGKVKPNRVSFFMWSIAPSIAFAAEIGQGVGLVSIQTLSAGVLPFFIFLASFVNKKARWEVERFDLICGALSVIGLIIWGITRVGNIAIVFSILADGLAALPTLRKAYHYPETEIAWPWTVTALGMGISLLTIKDWTFANYGFVLYLFLVTSLIALFAHFRPQSNTRKAKDELPPFPVA